MREAPILTVQVTKGHQGAPKGSLAERLLAAGFTLKLDLLPEDHAPDYDDETANAEVRRMMDRGDPWAWFHARLTISHPDASGLTGEDHLGGCGGYDETQWFSYDGGYWPDMVTEAFSDYREAAQAGARVLGTVARMAKLADAGT